MSGPLFRLPTGTKRVTWVRFDVDFTWNPRVEELTYRQFKVFVSAACWIAEQRVRDSHATLKLESVRRISNAKKQDLDLFLSLGLLLLAEDGTLSVTQEIVAYDPPVEKVPWDGGWTYFIQAVDGGPIKIGSTRSSPESRLAGLQTSSPAQLRIIGLVEGAHREKEFHAQFADWRLGGEWFDPDAPGLLELLAEVAASG